METNNPYAAPQSSPVDRNDTATQQDPEYRRIGGWLIVLAMFFCLDILVGVIGLSGYLIPVAWLSMRTLFNAVLCVASVAALVLMYRRSFAFPTFAIGYFVGCLLFALFFAAANGFGPDRLIYLGRPVAQCLVWIPYLARSPRVRRTFVR
jgi:hypothetical protein